LAQSPENRFKAYVISADGGTPQPLIPDQASEEGVPTWSKDGKEVVFGEALYRRDPSKMRIHLLDLGTHQLSTLPGSEGLWTTRWSSDGQYIAALVVGKQSPGCSPELRLFDWSTRNWTTLAHIDCMQEPTWSRDGKYIHFHTEGPNPALYRVRVADRHVERLGNLEEFSQNAEPWSGVAPDGSPLVARDIRIEEIYALDADWP